MLGPPSSRKVFPMVPLFFQGPPNLRKAYNLTAWLRLFSQIICFGKNASNAKGKRHAANKLFLFSKERVSVCIHHNTGKDTPAKSLYLFMFFFFRTSMVFCLPPSLTLCCGPPFSHRVLLNSGSTKPPCEKDIHSVSEVEWWHNFHIRQQSPSLFQSYFPHESFNVGLLEMALLTELQGGNIDYASWFHQVSGRNGMLKGKNKAVDEGFVCISRFQCIMTL